MKKTILYAFVLILSLLPFATRANVVNANTTATTTEDTRKDPDLAFYSQSIGILAGETVDANLINPYNLSPITYTSSNTEICQVDETGKIIAALVEETTVVTVTARFAGNDEYRSAEAVLEVGIVARPPLKTPVVTPQGGTFSDNVTATITTDDPDAVEIWYSTMAKSVDDFKDSGVKLSDIVVGKTASVNIDHSCTLYVMTRGTGTKSEIVATEFNIKKPLVADFTTDRSVIVDYDQEFDNDADLTGWEISTEWGLSNLKFGEINPSDSKSLSIGYAAGEGDAPLYTPEFDIKEGQQLEFYAYFKTKNLHWDPWTLDAIDCTTGDVTTLIDIFRWTRKHNYQSDDVMKWKKFSVDLSEFAGRKVQFLFDYKFDAENLAIDAFRLVRNNPDAADGITVVADQPIHFESRAEGEPEKIEWSFPGATKVVLDGDDAFVTYADAGTYDVKQTVTRDGKTTECSKPNFVTVSGRVPRALAALPTDAYESPYIGAFIPTGVAVQFADCSEGKPTEWHWQFDGTEVLKSNEQNPSIMFDKAGIYGMQLTAKNESGSATYAIDNCIQAGGEQNVWNISAEENTQLKPISYDSYGFYAGSNLFGLERFAEKYKAPLADAKLKSVEVFFAYVQSDDASASVPLTVYDVDTSGAPGKVLAETSLKVSELHVGSDAIEPTVFNLDKPVELTKGEEFFVAIGPFPSRYERESSGVMTLLDNIALYCVNHGKDGKHTTWDLAQGSDKWIANVSDNVSMAIAPLVYYSEYVNSVNGITNDEWREPMAIYNLSGQQVANPQHGSVYVVRYANGKSCKVMW